MSTIRIITSGEGGSRIAEIIRRRELLYFFIWRDIKIRYKETTLGVAWAVLVPLLQLAIFSFIFGRLVQIKPDGDYPYTLFVLTGLIPWTFFSQAFLQASQSLLNQQQLFTKVYFPRIFIPTAAVGGCLVDFLISWSLFLVVMSWYRFLPSWQVVFAPLLILALFVSTLGFAYLFSALTLRYRDLRYVVPVLVQIMMYVTPVVYPVGIVPAPFNWLLNLNPLSGLIDGLRSTLLGKSWDPMAVGVSSLVSIVVLGVGVSYFRSVERHFADIA